MREGFAKMLFQVLQSRAAGRKALLLGLFGRGDHRSMGQLLATGPVVGGRVGRRELDKARCVDGQPHGAHPVGPGCRVTSRRALCFRQFGRRKTQSRLMRPSDDQIGSDRQSRVAPQIGGGLSLIFYFE